MPNIIRVTKSEQLKENDTDRTCGVHEKIRTANKTSVGKPQSKRPLRFHVDWDNIKINVTEKSVSVWT